MYRESQMTRPNTGHGLSALTVVRWPEEFLPTPSRGKSRSRVKGGGFPTPSRGGSRSRVKGGGLKSSFPHPAGVDPEVE